MGKKLRTLDLVPISENGTEPKLDLVAIEEPVKKKDNTTSDRGLEDGTTQPGSADSSQPATKPVSQEPKPSGEPTEDSWFNKVGEFFAALPKAAITSAYNVIANQIPQEFKTEDLRMSHGSFNDFLNPSQREGASNIQSSGFEFPEVNNLKAEYRQWSNKQPYEVRSLPNDERIEKFFATKDQGEISNLRKTFNAKLSDYRLKLESEVSGQKKDSEKIMKGIPQSIRDLESVKDGVALAGKFLGEGVGRIVTSALTAGGGSIIAERAAVFDRQLDQMAEIVSKKTGADPDIARRMIIKYQQDKPEEGRVIADLAALLDIASIPVGTGKVAKSVAAPLVEGGTELIQSEMEEAGASKGSGADYEYDPIRSVDSFLGGVLGAKGIQMMMPREKTKPVEQVIKEESSGLSTQDLGGIEKAAEVITTPQPQEVITPEPVKETVAVSPVEEKVEPDIEVGNYIKKGGAWYLKEEDGGEQKILDLNRPVSESKGNENAEITELKKIQEQLSQDSGPKTINQSERNRIKDLPRTTLESRARGFFLDGGKIRWGGGRKKGAKEETGYKEDERRSLMAIQDNKNGLSPEEIGEHLAAKYEDDQYLDSDYRDQIIELLSQDRANWFSDQRNELDSDYGIGKANRDYELSQIGQRIEELENQEQGIQTDLKDKYENERRVYPASKREGSAKSTENTPEKGESKPDATARIREAWDESQGKQALEEISGLTLTHVPGLGMGQNQAKGTYVSTEKENRYQSEDNKPRPVTVKIKKPFVSKENVFYDIQRDLIKQRFDKNSVDDLTEAEADLLAEMISAEFINQGFDSIYFPESAEQEGELIVFNPKNVTIGNVSQSPESGTPTDQVLSNEPPSTPPPADNTSLPGSVKPGIRETVKKLREESNLHSEMKDGIEQFEKYEPRKRSQAREEAAKYIDSVGEDQALIDASKFKWGRSQEQKIAVLSELAERFSTQFKEAIKTEDEKAQNGAYSKFMAAMDALSANITDTAQALSYLNLVGTIFETKVGANRFAKNQIEESREGALRNYDALIGNAKRIIEEFDKLPKEDFLTSKRVQELIAQHKKQPSEKSRAAAKRVKDAGERLKQLWKENQSLGIIWDPKSQAKKDMALQKAVVDYVKAVIKKILIDTGEKIQAIKNDVVAEVKEFGKGIGLEIKDSDLSEIVDAQISETQIDEAKKKYKGDLKQAVEDYVKGNIKSKEDLIAKIIESEELDSEQAKKFTEDFEKLFNEYAAKKKDQLVKKYTPKEKPKEAKKKKEFYDKVIELSNSGAVTDQQLNDTVAQIFGLPQMTPEITTKIDDFVDQINKAPEGRFKNIAITKLTDFIVQQQKFNVTNYMLASYKAGIFSGIDTQALNLQGNFFNVLELGFIMGITNPRAMARFYKAMGNPKNLSRASLEALQTMETGYDPRMPGDKRRALEQTPRSLFGLGKPLKGWKQAFDPSLEQQKKYVFRALSAGDLLFSVSINDALQNELYKRAAKKKGLKGKEARDYVRQQMGYTPENIQKMGEMAKQEAQDGAIPNDKASITLRTYELIEQQRDTDIVEKSRAYASEQIMTNSPKGFIGEAAKGINHMIQRLPVLSAFIPVVNFAANAMSRAVQYMPHTAALRAVLHGADKKIKGEDISTQWKDFMGKMKEGDIDTEMRLRRAAVGVISMALMIGLTDEDDDGNNLLSELLGKTVKIHGFGPGTQFNRQKNYQKQESGWLPYSIQVGDKFFPYRNYPALNVLLATIGEYNDAKRYGKLDRKDITERFIFALGNSFKVISEMGFLTSLNTLTSALLEGDVKSIVDVPARTIQGFAFPKFQRNLTNLFDNKIYSRNNVQELVTRSMPVINSYANEPLVNALGEPIEKNWWDRVNLWQSKSYSEHQPIWAANNDKKYYFPVPSKFNIEQKFDRQITSEEYNEYFKKRGNVIAKEWKPDMAKLSKEEYKAKMDEITRYADYRTLVSMGAINSSPLKDIKHALYDVLSTKRDLQKMKQDLKP